MIDVISLNNGALFKRVFSKPSIFREFVYDVTGIEVDVEQIYTEYEYPDQIGPVKIKYDIFAEDTQQDVVIAIQHITEKSFFYRFLAHHHINILEQVRKYGVYEMSKIVYTIVILMRTPPGTDMKFSWGTNLMNLTDEYGNAHELAPHRLIIMNPLQRNERTPEVVEPWLELIEDSLDQKIDERNYPAPAFQEILAEIQSNRLLQEEFDMSDNRHENYN